MFKYILVGTNYLDDNEFEESKVILESDKPIEITEAMETELKKMYNVLTVYKREA